MGRHSVTWLVLFGGILLAAAACSNRTPSYPPRQPPAGLLQDSAAIAAGQQLFQKHCVTCHGTIEEGRMANAAHFSPEPPTFMSPRYRQLDPAYLFWRISKGKTVEPYLSEGSVMPAWGAYFNDEQIWQLVAYLRQRSAGKG